MEPVSASGVKTYPCHPEDHSQTIPETLFQGVGGWVPNEAHKTDARATALARCVDDVGARSTTSFDLSRKAAMARIASSRQGGTERSIVT